MSDQADALNKLALQSGLIGQPPAAPPRAVDDGEDGRPDLPWVQLPVDGRQAWAFANDLGNIVKALQVPKIFRFRKTSVSAPSTSAPGFFRATTRAFRCALSWQISRGDRCPCATSVASLATI